MTKCKISISTNRSFKEQEDARVFLKKLVDAGILFIHCFSDFDDRTTIKVNEINYYQTQALAKIDLKRFVDADILYLNVEMDKDN